MKVKQLLLNFYEEVFPPLFILYISRVIDINSVSLETLGNYLRLDDIALNKRLVAEHERAIQIDDKTTKFTLSLSIALTIISSIAASFIKIMPNNIFSSAAFFIFIASAMYMLGGSIVALGASRTYPKFGYGTYYEINKSVQQTAICLIKQERVNTIRHIRNELSFMSIRNGLLLLLSGLLICAYSFYLGEADTKKEIEYKIELCQPSNQGKGFI